MIAEPTLSPTAPGSSSTFYSLRLAVLQGIDVVGDKFPREVDEELYGYGSEDARENHGEDEFADD